MDFGPEWFWKLIGLLAIVGLISVVISVVKGIIWIINHVQFV